MKVAIVTPTIGAEHLLQCLESVQNQTYENLIHYVFLDGEEHYNKIHPMLFKASGKRTIKTISLQQNVGKGWYGHRVYAACAPLIDADVIIYLDEDNWIEPNHVESIVAKMQEGNDWVFSLRKIYDREGNYICEDNCESLGIYPVFFDDSVHHIDTSCFAVSMGVALRVGMAWYGQWGADRRFFAALKNNFSNFACTNEYSLCYRLDGNPNSVKKEFFIEGNKINSEKYNGQFPWKEKQHLLRVAPGISVVI